MENKEGLKITPRANGLKKKNRASFEGIWSSLE
jgi:hypothetical protein